MANKKIIVSSGDGKYQEVPSSSFSVDGDKLIVKNISVQTASFAGGTSGSIMQISGGILAPIWTTSSILAYSRYENDTALVPEDLSGTLFQYKTGMENYNGIGPHRIGSASFSGDVVGTISASIPARVISVANVNSGTLNSQFGGTGTGSFDVGSLVTLSGSGFNPSGNADKIVMADVSGDWSMQDKSLLELTVAPLTGAIVYLYTGSYSINNSASTASFKWKKPNNCKFIRVICQGAGGGGGNGSANTSHGGGWGGSGGGYADITFNGFTFTDAEIDVVVGNGGYATSGIGLSGGNGGKSSFGSFVYSNGGVGGAPAPGTPILTYTPGAIGFHAGGAGNSTSNLGGTSSCYLVPATSQMNVNFGGAGGGAGGYNGDRGGGYGGSIIFASLTGGRPGLTTNVSCGGIIGSTINALPPNTSKSFYFKNYYLNSTSSFTNIDFPDLLCAGGSGGGGTSLASQRGGVGSSATFGSGGGGGGKGTLAGSSGGKGGAGYVLIICT